MQQENTRPTELSSYGSEPAVVVETSPNNFQVWLNHGQVLEATISTRTAKLFAELFGGDPSSADWRHFGGLAGFTNPKPERELPSGMRPFASLRSAKGRVYSQAAEFLARTLEDEHNQPETVNGEQPYRRQRERVELRALKDFHDDAIYAGDLHRADIAWAKHASGGGLTLEQIRDELLNERDLSNKGNRKSQLEYAERTTRKAMDQTRR